MLLQIYQPKEEEFDKISSRVGVYQCVLKPFFLVFYYRMNFY